MGEINIGCGHCVLCNTGLSGHCRQRKVLGIKNHNGAFAEYLTLPLANLHAVPEHIPNEKAVFAEPVAAAARILEQVSIGPTSEVLVIGAGRLGLLIAQVINTTRCRLQVVARHEQQRQILGRLSIPAISEQQLPNQTADVVIEASGSPGGLQAAVHAVKPIGTIVLKSTYAGDSPFNFSPLVVDEIKLIGSRCGRFSTALTMLLSNQVNPGLLITGLYSLKDALAAFEAAAQPGALKILLQP